VLIKSVKSNVKCGVSADDLGPVVLVVGDNMAGKTAFAETIEIGLTGRSARLGATPSRLMQLAKGGSDTLSISLGLAGADGSLSVAKTTIEGSTTRASKPARDGAVAALVLGDVVTEVMAKEPKRRREAFLRLIAPKGILGQARASVPEAFAKRWDELIAEVKKEAGDDAPEADLLVGLSEAVREKTAAARRLVKQDSAPPAEPRPDATKIAALQAEIAASLAYDLAVQRRTAAAGRRQTLIDELAKMAPPPTDAVGLSLADIRSALALLEAASTVNGFLRDTGAEACPVCAGSGFDLAAAKAQIDTLRTSLKQAAAKSEQRVPHETLTRQRELADVEAVLAQELPAQGARPVGEPQGELSTLQAGESVWAAWEIGHKAALNAEADATTLAAIGKTSDRVVAEVLSKATAAFEEAASKSLPACWRFKLRLFDGKKAVCDVGIVAGADGKSATFIAWDMLSGAQQMACLAGLASAWAQKEIADAKVLIVDDVWFGPAMLSELLRGLVRVVGVDGGLTQAFVCAVSVEGVDPVEGVSLVALGGAS
jgi:hypothetical protein